MCGICGKISLSGNVTEELIRKMCGALTHRGPDDEGVLEQVSARTIFFERLAIVSAAGRDLLISYC